MILSVQSNMTTMLLAIALGSVRFEGGDACDLANSFYSSSGRPVAISVVERTKLAAFDYDLSDSTTFARTIRSASQLQQSPGTVLAFSDLLVPRSFIEVDPVFLASTATPLEGVSVNQAVNAGRVTLEMPKGAGLDRNQLSGLKLSKPLKLHWTIDRISIPIFCKDMPEAEFLNLIAKATGTRFVNTKEEFILELDPSEFRRRATETIKKYASAERMKNRADSQKWTVDMVQFALSIASDQAIRTAFSNRGGSMTIVLGGSTKQNAYSKIGSYARSAINNGIATNSRPQVLRERSAPQPNELTSNGSNLANLPGLFSSMDWNQDVGIVLYSNFNVRVVGFSASRNNRPGRPITIQFGRN